MGFNYTDNMLMLREVTWLYAKIRALGDCCHYCVQAARAIESIASKVGSTLEVDRRDVLVSLLVTGLAGRTWDGKEQLLSALGSLCKHSE